MTDVENTEKGKKIFSRAKDMEMALQCESLQKMLAGDLGAFSSRYWFINEYLNYGYIPQANPTPDRAIHPHEEGSTIKYIINSFRNIAKLTEIILHKKKMHPVDILFINRRRAIKVKTRWGYKEGDYVFHSIIDELDRDYPDQIKSIFFLDDSVKKYQYATVADVLRSARWSLEKVLRWWIQSKEVRRCLMKQSCKNTSRFIESFFKLQLLFRNALFSYSLSNFIDAKRPKAVISNDDCMYTRPLNSNCKIIVLQSASILRDIEHGRALIFKDPRMQPDFFLCSGSEAAEIKENVHAAADVIVTGQPRYDIIFNMNELYSKEEFKKTNGIKPYQKIVLWITQTHGLGYEENLKNLKAVFSTFQGLENVVLIIKQHPAETAVHTALINGFLEKYDVKAIITPKESDTYEQLFACDLIITKHSTSAIEAIAMDKPVIILNLSKKPDIIDYVSEKVAVGIYEEKDLRAAIIRLLNDDGELRENRETYLNRRLFRIDGNATKRVVDVIEKAIAHQEH